MTRAATQSTLTSLGEIMYKAEVLADSVAAGVRLTTLVVTFPRIVLAEQNTHRVFSRNTASSRAIPVETRCTSIEQTPFVPEAFGKNKKGMQSDELLDAEANSEAEAIWRAALADSLKHARALAKIGVHKQYANRLTEPFAWVTQIVTATEWDNYMNLRCHPAAQPEIQVVAKLMREEMRLSKPRLLTAGDWHLPFITAAEQMGLIDWFADGTYTVAELLKWSVARCAAVSYEKHSTQKSADAEQKMHDNLLTAGHMSPFEHQAQVMHKSEYGSQPFCGNFQLPWKQYRKTLDNERVFVSNT